MSDLSNDTTTDEKKAKPGKAPTSKEIGSNEITGSRISYKDRIKLTAGKRDDNYNYRIVNHDDKRYSGRIAEMQERGYTLCNDGESLGDSAGVGSSSIGSSIGKPVGNGVRGVLMRIPKKFYEEDKVAKQAEVDRTEEGMVADELTGADNTYGEGLKIGDSKGTRLEVSRRR